MFKVGKSVAIVSEAESSILCLRLVSPTQQAIRTCFFIYRNSLPVYLSR